MEQESFKRNPSNNKIFIGLLLIAGGILLFFNKMGYAIVPGWFFTWPVLIIGLGFIAGLKHNFQNLTWLFLMVWGAYELFNQQIPSLKLDRFALPVGLVLLGSFFIFRRNKHYHFNDWKNSRFNRLNQNVFTSNESNNNNGEFIDSTCVFSGSKKVVISKNFKGADVTAFMGGAEIDLSQADIQGQAVIDATAVFGGIKIIVPSNWDLKIQNTSAFGNIEDKRRIQNLNADASKQLVIDGTAVFGGIEIINY